MKKQYIFTLILCISTGAFILWYFSLYQWSEQYISQYEKNLQVCIKNCSRTNKLQRSCKGEQEVVAALNNQCQQCIVGLQADVDDTVVLATLIELIQAHKLTLTHYKRIAKDKKEWYTRYTTSLLFEGLLGDTLTFIETVSHNSYGIVPLKIEMHTDSKCVTHVTATISWIVCRR